MPISLDDLTLISLVATTAMVVLTAVVGFYIHQREWLYSQRLSSLLRWQTSTHRVSDRGHSMPEQETILRMFVSSPSDVKDERTVLESVIKDLNPTWSKAFGLRLRPLIWETHVPSGIAENAQEVIARRIGDDYEIYFGIIGIRLGSPTEQAESGTVQEFEAAYERFMADPESISIMVYFKDTPVNPSELDLEEYSRVVDFRNRLEESGVLYHTFSDSTEFGKLLRLHLPQVVKDWRDRVELAEERTEIDELSIEEESPPDEHQTDSLEPESEAKDYGLLDLVDEGFDKSAEFEEVVQSMTDTTRELTEKLALRMEQLEEVGEVTDRKSVKRARAIIAGTVGDVTHFAAQMEGTTPVFAETYEEFIDIQSRLSIIGPEFAEVEELEELRNQRRELLDSIRVARRGASELRDTIDDWPSIEKNLNKAKARAVEAMDEFVKEARSAEKLTEELISSSGLEEQG